MPHTRTDIIQAKHDYIEAADRLLEILAGERQAIENAKRAVNMMDAIDEPMEEKIPEHLARRTIKDLAAKMAGNGQ
jgi:hypothetical protein